MSRARPDRAVRSQGTAAIVPPRAEVWRRAFASDWRPGWGRVVVGAAATVQRSRKFSAGCDRFSQMQGLWLAAVGELTSRSRRPIVPRAGSGAEADTGRPPLPALRGDVAGSGRGNARRPRRSGLASLLKERTPQSLKARRIEVRSAAPTCARQDPKVGCDGFEPAAQVVVARPSQKLDRVLDLCLRRRRDGAIDGAQRSLERSGGVANRPLRVRRGFYERLRLTSPPLGDG